jgi:competence protein ComEC
MKAELAGRPLLAASLGLMVGISALAHPLNILFLVVLLAVCWKRVAPCIWASAACLLGVLVAPPQPQQVAPTTTGTIAITGTVVTPPTVSLHGESCLVDTGEHLYSVTVRGRRDLALGQQIHVFGLVFPLTGKYGLFARTEGASGEVVAFPNSSEIVQRGPVWFETAGRLRRSFLESIHSSLSGHAGALVEAMCFGTSSEIAASAHTEIEQSGVAYILSVSGIQVYLLALFVQIMLSRLPIKRSVQVIATILVLALYVSATGLHPSTIRAAVVASLTLAAYMFRREPDVLSAAGFAAILTLLWQPWEVYTPGFQISYVTLVALCLFWRPPLISDQKGFFRVLVNPLKFALKTSFVAWLAAWPLTAFHFGEVSVFAPLTSLLIGPVIPVVVGVALIAWPLSGVAPALHTGLLHLICEPLAKWILVVTGLAWHIEPFLTWPVFNAYWLVLYYGGFLLIWHRSTQLKG